MAMQTQTKKMIVVGIAILFIMVAFMAFLFKSNEPAVDTSKIKNAQTSNVGAQSVNQKREINKNALYQQQLKEYNEKQDELAQLEAKTSVKIMNPDKTPPPPPKLQVQQQVDNSKKEQDELLKLLTARKLAFLNMMKQQSSSEKIKIVSLEDKNTSKNENNLNNTTNNINQTLNNQKPPKQIIAGGEQVTAVLNEELDTDIDTEVFATIKGGILDNTLISGKVSMKGDYIYLKFDKMYFNKQTLTINAVGMDPETNKALLTGEIDNRYFERFGFPFLVALVSGAGQVASRAVSQVDVASGGSVSVSTTKTGDKEVIGGALQSGATALSQAISESKPKGRVIRRAADAIIAFICFGLLYWLKESASDPGNAVMLFVAFGIVTIPVAIIIFLMPFKVLHTLLEANIVGGIKECFLTDKKMPDLPNNVFECRLEIFLRFLESTRSMAQFEILLNQAQLNNVDLIINAIHITNMEKMQLIESILSQQRTCMNHFDMVYLDIEREKLYEKIYEKKLAKNFFTKWIELTKKSSWIGFILGVMSFIGGAALMSAISGGVCCAAIFGGIRTLFYYLISNRLLNKNIENRMKASQVVQQYLNQQKENLIRKIQYCC